MNRLVIAPKGDKGRSFSAELLAYVEANYLWEFGSSGDATRPIWMVVAGSEQEMRSFNANLLTGKKAEVDKGKHSSGSVTRYEILKSGNYLHYSRKIGNAVVTTYLLPDLLRIDPGMVDPKHIRFAILPTRAWVQAQTFDLAAARARILALAGLTLEDIESLKRKYDSIGELFAPLLTDAGLHHLLAEGSLFLAYLDRRCRYPLTFDPVFGAWLILISTHRRLLTRGERTYAAAFKVEGVEHLNMSPGFGFHASHETFGEVLSEEIRRWWHGGQSRKVG